jgi:pimeloyl-ACP methyl ester carboxylesterase
MDADMTDEMADELTDETTDELAEEKTGTMTDDTSADATARPALILHGGGGPFTVASIATQLGTLPGINQTITPTHPGWNGTPLPADITSIVDLTTLYLEYLEANDLHDVLLVGSSLGGWIAADMASRDTAGRIGRLVLIDATGIEVPDEPMIDFFALDARGVAEFAWHDSERFYVDPATVPAEQQAAQRANMTTMAALAGDPYMHDPSLFGRLGDITVPTLLVWGDSDRIVTPAYGAAFAAAIPDARLAVIEKAGHLPHLEQPEATFAVIEEFLQR